MTRLIKSGEWDVQMLVVRYSFERALDLVDSDPAHGAQLVTTALEIVEPALFSEQPTEGLEAETQHAISRLRAVISQEKLAVNWARVALLEKQLGARGTAARQ